MSVEVSGVTLVSPNPAGCCDPYTWNIALSVPTAQPPKGTIDICVTFGDPDCNADRDVVLDEMEIDGSSLRKGKNLIQIDHDALPFEKLRELMDDERIQCPLMMTFRYVKNEETTAASAAAASPAGAATPIFHTVGVQVNIRLRDGLAIEEVEAFDDPSLLVREALVDSVRFGRGVVHMPREIEWDKEDEEEEEADAKDEKEGAAGSTGEGTAAANADGSDASDEEEMFGSSDDDESDGEEPSEKKLRSE